MNVEEEFLIQKAINGDKNAFGLLLKNNYEQIYRTAYLYCGNKEDTLDIIQETAFQGLQSIKTLKNPEFFVTWLIKILLRCSMKHMEKKNKNILTDEDTLAKLESTNTSVNFEEKVFLRELIDNLSFNYKTALILFYYKDFSIKDISRFMKVPENTVKTYLSRGRKLLKFQLEKGDNFE